MAASTFTKQFSVERKKANEFVAEMSKKVTPTLQPDFKSNLVRLSQDNEQIHLLSVLLSRHTCLI